MHMHLIFLSNIFVESWMFVEENILHSVCMCVCVCVCVCVRERERERERDFKGCGIFDVFFSSVIK